MTIKNFGNIPEADFYTQYPTALELKETALELNKTVPELKKPALELNKTAPELKDCPLHAA